MRSATAQQIRAFRGGQGRDRTADPPLFRWRLTLVVRIFRAKIPVFTGFCTQANLAARGRTETKTETKI